RHWSWPVFRLRRCPEDLCATWLSSGRSRHHVQQSAGGARGNHAHRRRRHPYAHSIGRMTRRWSRRAGTNDRGAAAINQLDVRMSVPDVGDCGPIYPVARLLIDGEDLLADVGRWRLVPWPAHELLTNSAPLLPVDPPRRVIVYAGGSDPEGL